MVTPLARPANNDFLNHKEGKVVERNDVDTDLENGKHIEDNGATDIIHLYPHNPEYTGS